MVVTVSDFNKITGKSRHTVYSWIYRNKLPQGIKAKQTISGTYLLNVSKESEYYDQVKEKS